VLEWYDRHRAYNIIAKIFNFFSMQVVADPSVAGTNSDTTLNAGEFSFRFQFRVSSHMVEIAYIWIRKVLDDVRNFTSFWGHLLVFMYSRELRAVFAVNCCLLIYEPKLLPQLRDSEVTFAVFKCLAQGCNKRTCWLHTIS